ncbi:disulfide bond formation protein B [Rhodovulum adriaticum]|uniref:Disulfide bond formation protein DsbB n=1 Tax=Rhodovulum adriaticum TaxID=35804 RepID=A0A4R2NVN0_RHOAD|nr:disulfide bond formation protein B [Rhodovulum adriaticum]MBK1636582.1 disulfide bond formation protein B [Rhodovulum adriaticum]TCP26070.1 disulfide bond formation protein DsbB [Rhodovulum adriaticum]
MIVSRDGLIALAGLGSAAVLAAGFSFQYLGGLAPCELCLWQRWPHAGAVLLMVGALLLGGRMLPLAGLVTMIGSAGLGAYHTGVERHWWAGPDSCTAGAGLSGLSGADLLNPALATPVVLCDEVVWQMFGLSMASYNFLISLALAVLWAAALASGRADRWGWNG